MTIFPVPPEVLPKNRVRGHSGPRRLYCFSVPTRGGFLPREAPAEHDSRSNRRPIREATSTLTSAPATALGWPFSAELRWAEEAGGATGFATRSGRFWRIIATAATATARRRAAGRSTNSPRTRRCWAISSLWWAVLKNVRAGLMPPAGEDQPTSSRAEADPGLDRERRVRHRPAESRSRPGDAPAAESGRVSQHDPAT